MSARLSSARSRTRVSLVVCAVVFLGLFFSTPAWAGIGFQPVNPDELKMTGDPLAPGAPAIILYRQVDRDDNRYTPHEDNYLRIKILNEEGRKHANVEIPFDKLSESITGLHARTIKPDGSTVEFDGKVFEKTVVKGKGLRYLVKNFSLPNVEVGSIIEYYYTDDFKEGFVFNSHWILSQDLFIRSAKFSLKPYTSYDNQFHLRYSWQQLPDGVAPKQLPHGIVEMEAHNIPAFNAEDYMPPENELKARVDFIYDEELPEKDADHYWEHMSKKWNGYLDSFVDKRKAMEEAVSQVISTTDAPEVKLRKIYDRVQQMRNTTYEIEKTEQEEKREKEKAINNVEDVWKRGYGTERQLNWLFLALARAAGFEVYGCWVANRRDYFFNPNIRQSQKLDVNVVLVKLNGNDAYFAPGVPLNPFGMLPWAITSVTGRKLDGNSGTWIQTTLPQAAQSQTHREAKLKLSSDTGDLEGKLTVTYTGLDAFSMRFEERHEDAATRKKYAEDSVKEQIPAAAEVELTNSPDWTSSETPLVTEFNLKIPGWASSTGKRAMLPVGFFGNYEKHVFEHADRTFPIYFQYPYQKIEDVTIELPAGWKIDSVPPQKTQDAKVLVYDLKVDNNGATLHVARKLTVDFLLLDPKYYPALRKFFEVVRNNDEQQILLQPGQTAAVN